MSRPIDGGNAGLSAEQIDDLTLWRRDLHSHPDLSGDEDWTARRVVARLAFARPDDLVPGLGGTGVAAVFAGEEDGPTVLFRAELDALPIEELSDCAHRSQYPGKAHLCGHDGHMAILAGLAEMFAAARPKRGRAILLFQPAEETGAGAAAVVADPSFRALEPDYAFALHNWPGIPLGRAVLAAGPANCASRGLRVVLRGRTAHASMPETGRSPMGALVGLMPALTALGEGSVGDPDFAMATVTHAALGKPAFGVAPGEALIYVTLRTATDDRMTGLRGRAEELVAESAASGDLGFEITDHDVFRHCENHPEAVGHLRSALDACGVGLADTVLPMRPSEDFGRFGDDAKAAMVFLGAGAEHPSLHNPDYDFPDALIPSGIAIFHHVARRLLG